MVLGMTRAQIIEQGLDLAGRPDLTSQARVWLSMFLEDVYMNQDLEWLTKYVTDIDASQNGEEVPNDYRAAKSATLVHPNGSTSRITFLTKDEEIEEKIMQQAGATGTPQWCYIADGEFNFIPTANQDFTMNLRYYYIPEIGEIDSELCDDDVPTWGMPFSILVDHVKARAMEYNDDQRQTGAETQVKNKFMEAKMNNHDRRAGPSRIKMGKRFKKRF